MISVRPAIVDDSDRIARAHIRTWQAAYAQVLPAAYRASFDPSVWTDRRRRQIAEQTPPDECIVAEVDHEIVGHATVGRFRDADSVRDPAVGEILATYVVPEQWSGGVGPALLRAGIDHLVRYGLREIRLWVIADNSRGRRLYERFGFLADGGSRLVPAGADYPDAAPVEHIRYTLRDARSM
ncbi:MAG TPA: GNAT family N-acetyltransferase [Micromonosporaceae bacterium]|jgi:RimJ/RimL family protein N-acetyltransferase